jgi:hypothetical protein
VLVENHGHTVGKEELFERVWPGTFVEEGNLARHISVLRQVLGQAQSGPQYIETIPKRGYRFVAPVRQVDPSPAEVQLRETPPAGPLPILRPVGLRGVALAAAVVMLAAGAAILGWRRSPDAVPQYTQLTNYADSATSPALSPAAACLRLSAERIPSKVVERSM